VEYIPSLAEKDGEDGRDDRRSPSPSQPVRGFEVEYGLGEHDEQTSRELEALEVATEREPVWNVQERMRRDTAGFLDRMRTLRIG
jgi:hypothetical protein